MVEDEVLLVDVEVLVDHHRRLCRLHVVHFHLNEVVHLGVCHSLQRLEKKMKLAWGIGICVEVVRVS